MKALAQAALEYVSRGWPAFPLHGIRSTSVGPRSSAATSVEVSAEKTQLVCTCGRLDCSSPGKHPLTRHGLKDASVDSDVIAKWWSKWPNANIGVATGEASGVVVIDLDLPVALGSIDRVIHKLPRTLTGVTGGGGLHLLYRGRPSSVGPRASAATSLGGNPQEQGHKLRCTTGRLPGIRGPLPGIDLRADGGYVVVPPSIHASGNRYSWLDPAADIAAAPAWLAEPPRHENPAAPQSPPRFSSGDGTAYGLAALDNALTSLAQAPVGQRNHTLNRVAFSMARLVTAGHLAELPTRAALHSTAVAIGLTEHEACLTIDSAFRAGTRVS